VPVQSMTEPSPHVTLTKQSPRSACAFVRSCEGSTAPALPSRGWVPQALSSTAVTTSTPAIIFMGDLSERRIGFPGEAREPRSKLALGATPIPVQSHRRALPRTRAGTRATPGRGVLRLKRRQEVQAPATHRMGARSGQACTQGGSSGLSTGREHHSGGPVSGPPRPPRTGASP
jgi:hypothetical protein